VLLNGEHAGLYLRVPLLSGRTISGNLRNCRETAMPDTDLLTISEASAVLRLKPSTLRAWILKRKLLYCKLGSRVFIRRSDCEALVSRSVVPAAVGLEASGG
jgi:excisionase family DNA binding protein